MPGEYVGFDVERKFRFVQDVVASIDCFFTYSDLTNRIVASQFPNIAHRHPLVQPHLAQNANYPLPNLPTTYNPHPSKSLIKQAICALFAASATKLKSLKNGDVSS